MRLNLLSPEPVISSTVAVFVIQPCLDQETLLVLPELTFPSSCFTWAQPSSLLLNLQAQTLPVTVLRGLLDRGALRR